jgi:acyl-CoA thioester hydrolase
LNPFKIQVRVYYEDVDIGGVVYYANYLRYFESARAAYWRDLGKSYQDLVEWDVALPVVEAHCNYKRPAFYEDLLVVDTDVSEVRGASLRFAYRVLRGTDLLAEGHTRHAVIGPDGRPKALPPMLRDAIPRIVGHQARSTV